MQQTPFLRAKDHLVSGQEFDLVWNEDGKSLKTSPAPDDVMPYYDAPEYISHSDGSSTVAEKLYQLAKTFNLKNKRQLIETFAPQRGAILDIGAGTGDFLRYMGKQGWRTHGVEPGKAARERASEKGLELHAEASTLPGDAFDVVTLWHVFEHLPNPEAGIREFSRVLKSRGWLVLALPNFRSLDARHYRSFWAAYDVPRHLWHYSREAIPALFEPLGYKLVSVKPLWLDAFYISWLSEKHKGSRIAPIKGLFWGLASNLFGCVKGEFSSHIYVLQKTD